MMTLWTIIYPLKQKKIEDPITKTVQLYLDFLRQKKKPFVFQQDQEPTTLPGICMERTHQPHECNYRPIPGAQNFNEMSGEEEN